MLHTYLSGMAVEVMPPGDNVIRGGLTSKHVDTMGLANVIDSAAPPVAVQRSTGPVHAYDGPGEGILVRRLIDTDLTVQKADGPHLVLGTAGITTVQAAGEMVIGPGEALKVPAARGLCGLAVDGEAYLVTSVLR